MISKVPVLTVVCITQKQKTWFNENVLSKEGELLTMNIRLQRFLHVKGLIIMK